MKYALLPRLCAIFLLIAGCRMMEPTSQLRPASSPDISRLILLNGQTLIFNKELGWYDKNASMVEGVTEDSLHVTIPVKEINRVETVRAYSVFFLIAAAAIPLALGIYGLWKFFTLL